MKSRLPIQMWIEKRILISKITLLCISGILLFVSFFRVGYSFGVNGVYTDGIYSRKDIEACVKYTETIVSDIMGETTSLKHLYRKKWGIVRRDVPQNIKSVQLLMLDAVPGMTRACAVKIDGTLIGWVSDASTLGEVTNCLLGERAKPETRSLKFMQEITGQVSYAREDDIMDILTLSAMLRQNTEIIAI